LTIRSCGTTTKLSELIPGSKRPARCYHNAMSELKTLPNDGSVTDFINSVPDATKRADSRELLDLFKRVTGKEPQMWGSSIIGYGMYHYKSKRSSQEGDWPLTGFSPRKQTLTLYVMHGLEDHADLLDRLGKCKTSRSCLYINKLADVDMTVLENLVTISYTTARRDLNPTD
jgi:hypothetical protein